MKPTRRQLAVAGSLSLASLSGCVGVLVGGGDDGEEDTSQSESNTDSSTSEVDDNEGEDENEDEDTSASGSQEIIVRSDEIRNYLSWIASTYDEAVTEYFQVVDSIDQTLENLKERDINDIGLDEITSVADDLRATAQTTDSLFGEYYSIRYDFESVASQIESDLRPSLRRREYESATELLYRIERKVSFQKLTRTIRYWFPRYVVFREPYTRYYNADEAGGNKIFESYISTAGGRSAALYAAPGQMNINQSPFRKRQESELFDWSLNNQRNTNLIDISNWLRSGESQSIVYINIIDYNLKDGGYPGEFVAEPDTSASTLRGLDIPDFNDSPHLSVCIQGFEDSSTAESAMDKIVNTGSESGEITHGGISYQKLFYFNELEQKTYYADVTNIDNYVVAVDISPTQWQDRPTYSQTGDSSRTEYLLADTWLIPSSN